VLKVFEKAVQFQHGVISVLKPPMDAQRANLVQIPFVITTPEKAATRGAIDGGPNH
jgi:hypothetical protein